MYNQPTKVMPDGRHVGLLYKNPIDCLWKTLKTEGPFGWYKGACDNQAIFADLLNTSKSGSTAHFLRIAPHTCVLFEAFLFIGASCYTHQDYNADRERRDYRPIQEAALRNPEGR